MRVLEYFPATWSADPAVIRIEEELKAPGVVMCLT